MSWISASAPHSTASANKSHLDPCSSGTGAVQWVQKHEPAHSSVISPMAGIDHEIESNDYRSFAQFDVVQDFSDHHYANSSPGKKLFHAFLIDNNWIILVDCSETIYVRVYEQRMDLLRAAIVGPAGTPYHDGLFFFDVRFPSDYPKCPPKVHYHSGGLRLNPNLYESGKVCLSLLNTWWGNGCEKWAKSNSTMLQVLVSIQGLVLNDKPYFNEPGNKNSTKTAVGEKNSLAYNQTAFILSCKTMLYSLRKPPKHFETLVACHFIEREHVILESCGAYLSGTIVGSSVRNGTKYACDKCFADFTKSLAIYTEQLRTEFASNNIRILELEKEASSADEIVPAS
ncbi:hypothetical protein EJB05_32779 [Eragrostis curvula]|uniref:E2 ubiquitin-conjugating enzyme n=1 Tax=Eragrostis curvula TaxID=38414 RepID=A0A5J9UH04_9POAL|nr:hypothetical protein EJB05_32779 [Eragrostis curvula]